MSEQAISRGGHAAEGAHHAEDPMSHVPPGSFWPLILTVGLVIGFTGALIQMQNPDMVSVDLTLLAWKRDGIGLGAIGLGSLVFVFALMGWCHQIIKEKPLSHSLLGQQADLKFFVKLFLVSELMAFGAVFAYYYLRRLDLAVAVTDFAAPEGLHLGGPLVALATILLLSSSVTCEFAHHAVMHGQQGRARLLLIATLVLGIVFLGFQGREYGELITHGFWPGALADNPLNSYATVFFIGTGFHGLHVLTGLVMLFLVYMRLELGHFTPQRHFAFVAASWYWHFVDVVWVLLFITIYVF